jgi:hypothetical protein
MPTGDQHEDDRRRFVAATGSLAALGLRLEELCDPDVRAVVVHHEHPEFERALAKRGEVDVGDGPMNPRLHLVMHAIVATQLWQGSPPEVWETAVRLLDAGYERHEILHMLASSVVEQLWESLDEEDSHDRERHLAALRSLPGSWERERACRTTEGRRADARKQARRAARAARQRKSRPS